jgi:hypothetical protein
MHRRINQKIRKRFIIERQPLNTNKLHTYYFLSELNTIQSAIFLDTPRFATTLYQILIRPRPQEIQILHLAVSHIFSLT